MPEDPKEAAVLAQQKIAGVLKRLSLNPSTFFNLALSKRRKAHQDTKLKRIGKFEVCETIKALTKLDLETESVIIADIMILLLGSRPIDRDRNIDGQSMIDLPTLKITLPRLGENMSRLTDVRKKLEGLSDLTELKELKELLTEMTELGFQYGDKNVFDDVQVRLTQARGW